MSSLLRAGIGLLGLLGIVGSTVVLAGDAPAGRPDPRRTAVERARQDGLRLIREGRYEDAIDVFGPWANELRKEVWRLVADAKRRGDQAGAVRLYDAFLRFFPWGCLSWHHDSDVWNRAACDFVPLREQVSSSPPDSSAREDVAALELYRRSMESHARRDSADCAHWADEILTRYPRSVFCPAAILSVGHLAEQGYKSSGTAIGIYEGYLERMKAAGALSRSRTVVLLALANAYEANRGGAKRDRDIVRATEVYDEISRLTEIPYERRYCLLKKAKSVLASNASGSAATARKLLEQFLAEYGNVFPDADEARLALIETYLAERDPHGALAALRLLERRFPDASSAKSLFAISRSWSQREAYDRALELLREIEHRLPDTPTTSLARLGMAETYEKLGDEAKTVAAYELAAGGRPVDTGLHAMDASNTNNRAVQWLGTHHLDRGNWKEALAWWTSWQPSSVCGTCADSMRMERAYYMALCKIRLGEHAAAAAFCLPAVCDRRTPAPDLAALVVQLYAQAGQLDDLLQMADSSATSLREMVRIWGLAARRDVAQLISLCADSGEATTGMFQRPGQGWRGRAAADALATCGGEEIRPIRKALDDGRGEGSWLIYALGKSSSSQALYELTRLLRWKPTRGSDIVYYALLLKGDAGRKVLQRSSAKASEFSSSPAQKWLDYAAKRPYEFTPLPSAQPGSLPKSVEREPEH